MIHQMRLSVVVVALGTFPIIFVGKSAQKKSSRKIPGKIFTTKLASALSVPWSLRPRNRAAAATCGHGRCELPAILRVTPKSLAASDFFAAAEAKNPAISAAEWLRARLRPPWSLRFCDAIFVPLSECLTPWQLKGPLGGLRSLVWQGVSSLLEIPTNSCHFFFCTPGNPCATPIVTRGEGSFSFQGVSTRGLGTRQFSFVFEMGCETYLQSAGEDACLDGWTRLELFRGRSFCFFFRGLFRLSLLDFFHFGVNLHESGPRSSRWWNFGIFWETLKGNNWRAKSFHNFSHFFALFGTFS